MKTRYEIALDAAAVELGHTDDYEYGRYIDAIHTRAAEIHLERFVQFAIDECDAGDDILYQLHLYRTTNS